MSPATAEPSERRASRRRVPTGAAVAWVALGLAFGSCASFEPASDGPLPQSHVMPGMKPEVVLVRPPTTAEAPAEGSAPATPSVSVGSDTPRLVWVPEWKLYLREGRDVVEHKERFYLWADGQWHVAATDQGPWRPVAPPASPAPATGTTTGERAGSTTGERIARLATRHLGARYAWGGASPAGFDCSGFVMYVYAEVGVALPHSAARQYAFGRPVGRDQLQPGDLVFFDRLHHNGIFIGDGQFVHANKRGGGVRISRLDEPWFSRRWMGARRLLGPAPDEGAGRRADRLLSR